MQRSAGAWNMQFPIMLANARDGKVVSANQRQSAPIRVRVRIPRLRGGILTLTPLTLLTLTPLTLTRGDNRT